MTRLMINMGPSVIQLYLYTIEEAIQATVYPYEPSKTH